MKVATFNINNVNKRLPNLLAWLATAKPDVVCLQELKASQDAFPAEAIRSAGYGAVWRGERTWNGVAILARDADPILVRDTLPGDENDRQSRYIEAAVNGILIGSIYLPNGNPQPGPKFDYKRDWFNRLIDHAAGLVHDDIPAVLAGDYNVVPTDRDIYSMASWANDALTHPDARAAFAQLVDMGWTDAIRSVHADDPMFSFWSYLRQRWPRNAGLRLDHLLLSPVLAPRLQDAGVDRQIRGEANASDHAPAWIVLESTQTLKKTSRRRM